MRDIFIGLEGNKSVVYEIKTQVHQVSMRKGILKDFGGDLPNLYSSPRFDSRHLSRDTSGKTCRKDWHCSNKNLDRKGMHRHISRLERTVKRQDCRVETYDPADFYYDDFES